MAAKFPTALATDADLLVVLNRKQTTLVGNLNSSDTAFTLAADAFAANVAITIGSEIILILTKTGAHVDTCTRAYDGTSAASHLDGTLVSAFIDAHHHTQLKEEVIAIETALGTNLSNIPTIPNPWTVNKGGTGVQTITGILEGHGTSAFTGNAAASELTYLRRKPNNGSTAAYEFVPPPLNALYAADYEFTRQAPAENLSPTLRTVTMAPVPLGINGADTTHWVGIYNNAGVWQENALINGGSAVSGAATGTLTFASLAGTYATGAYKIGTVTAGMAEAHSLLDATYGGTIVVAVGRHTVNGPFTFTKRLDLLGMVGAELVVPATFPLTAGGVIVCHSAVPLPYATAGSIRNLKITFTQPTNQPDPALMVHFPPGIKYEQGSHLIVECVTMELPWFGIDAGYPVNGLILRDLWMSPFFLGVSVQDSYDTVIVDNMHIWPYGAANGDQLTAFLAAPSIGIDVGNVSDMKISNTTFANNAAGSLSIFGHKSVATGFGPALWVANSWFESPMSISDAAYASFKGTYILSTGSASAMAIAGGSVVSLEHMVINSQGSGPTFSFVANAAVASGATGAVPSLDITDSEVRMYAGDHSTVDASILAPYAGKVNLNISNMKVWKDPTVAYGNPVVSAGASVQASIDKLLVTPLTSGSGIAVSLATDEWHSVTRTKAVGYSITWPATVTKLDRWGNQGILTPLNSGNDPTVVAAKLSSTNLTSKTTENYIATESGAANAIAGALLDAAGVAVPLTAGLKVVVKLAHALRAGANTFDFNAGGALAIKSAHNVATNINTAYAATGVITLLYDGTRWLELSKFSPTENYVASETGANNAIAGALLDAAGTAVALAAGLRVVVQLAHTLRAGSNTFNLNGGGAVAIKSAHNVSNDLTTGYAATGTITLTYDGTEWVDAASFTTVGKENYIASETGANNAIVGALLDGAGVAVPLAAGLRVVVQLAHTLQAGGNQFNFNAGGLVDIKSSRNVANNIGTAYAATGAIALLYDGTRWVDLSQ